MKNWTLKHGINVVKKKKNDYEKWADKFEGGTPSRAEYDKLSKADQSKAKIHMGSKRAASTKSNSLHPEKDNIKFDMAASNLQDKIKKGTTKKRMGEQELDAKRRPKEIESMFNLETHNPTAGSSIQSIRRIMNKADNEGEIFKSKAEIKEPKKILRLPSEEQQASNIRFESRPMVKKEKQKMINQNIANQEKRFKKKEKKGQKGD